MPGAHDLHTPASQVSSAVFIPGTSINTTALSSPVILGIVLVISVAVRQTGPGTLCCPACPWANVSLSNKMQSNYESVTCLSHAQLFVTPWTVAHQAHLSMEFFKQEYWSGLPFPPPGNLPDPQIELMESII